MLRKFFLVQYGLLSLLFLLSISVNATLTKETFSCMACGVWRGALYLCKNLARLGRNTPAYSSTLRLVGPRPRQPTRNFDVPACAFVVFVTRRVFFRGWCHVPRVLGCTEEAKAAELTEKLGVEVKRSMVVLSHSPMRVLAVEFSRKRVMVLGSSAKEIAREDLGLLETVSSS